MSEEAESGGNGKPRRDRLANALRENLRKRKSQARARQERGPRTDESLTGEQE